jgi:uncharacterized protein with PQ loop repeat
MAWQDIIIMICTILFSYALIPQVLEGFRKKKGLINLQTAAITAPCLYILAFCFFTLQLYFSMAANILAGTLWSILLFQRLRYGKP